MTVASFQLRIARLGIQFEPEYSLLKFWHETKVVPGGGPSVYLHKQQFSDPKALRFLPLHLPSKLSSQI